MPLPYSGGMDIGLLVRLVAKPEKAEEVATFLRDAVAVANDEQGTPLWCAVRLDNDNFVIFDAHHDEAARQAHLQGKIAAQLMGHAQEWFAKEPVIEMTTFLSSKLPAAIAAP